MERQAISAAREKNALVTRVYVRFNTTLFFVFCKNSYLIIVIIYNLSSFVFTNIFLPFYFSVSENQYFLLNPGSTNG